MRWQWSGILVQILLHAASKLAQYVNEDRAASGLYGILDREAFLPCRIEQFEDEVSVC